MINCSVATVAKMRLAVKAFNFGRAEGKDILPGECFTAIPEVMAKKFKIPKKDKKNYSN